MRKTLILGAALAAVAGCSTIKPSSKTTVDDMEVARLDPSQLSEVNDLRTQVTKSKDDAARAELAVRDAESRHDIAKSQVDVAKEQVEIVKKRVEAAEKSRDQQAAAAARNDLEPAQKKVEIAEANVNVHKERVDVAKAEKEVADKQVDLLTARREQAEFRALQRANDPAAKEYTQAEFDKRIQDEQQQLSKAQQKVRDEAQQFSEARKAYQQQSGVGGTGEESKEKDQEKKEDKGGLF